MFKMSELQSHDPESDSQMAEQLRGIRPQVRKVVDNTEAMLAEGQAVNEDTLHHDRQSHVRREEREQKEPVVKVVENADKGEMTISIPPTMEEAKEIAKEIPKAQRAATRQKYASMAADIAITTLMAVSSVVLIAFAAKGLSSIKDD